MRALRLSVFKSMLPTFGYVPLTPVILYYRLHPPTFQAAAAIERAAALEVAAAAAAEVAQQAALRAGKRLPEGKIHTAHHGKDTPSTTPSTPPRAHHINTKIPVGFVPKLKHESHARDHLPKLKEEEIKCVMTTCPKRFSSCC